MNAQNFCEINKHRKIVSRKFLKDGPFEISGKAIRLMKWSVSFDLLKIGCTWLTSDKSTPQLSHSPLPPPSSPLFSILYQYYYIAYMMLYMHTVLHHLHFLLSGPYKVKNPVHRDLHLKINSSLLLLIFIRK